MELIVGLYHPRQSDLEHSHAGASDRRHPRMAGRRLTKRNPMTDFSPREIVSELDRFIVGQNDAKRAVAIALRNRWRRLQLDDKLREEVLPKNILMIGPTGVGKTEISRRLARLAGAPFLKVEATKFTEVGYVGRDVEQIVRDLVEISIALTRETKRKDVQARAELAAEERVLDALVGPGAQARPRARASARGCAPARSTTRKSRSRCSRRRRHADVRNPRHAGRADGRHQSIGDIFGKLGGARTKTRRVTVRGIARHPGQRGIRQAARQRAAGSGIDQRGRAERHRLPRRDRQDRRRARAAWARDVSREGVQRDLLPLIEGTTVNTKHGPVKTDHILFIASGAFHISKPSDLLPELQGRLPIRVELQRADARRLPPHPDRAGSLADQAIRGTDGDRRRNARFHRGRHRRHRRHRGGGEFQRSRISARAGCRR